MQHIREASESAAPIAGVMARLEAGYAAQAQAEQEPYCYEITPRPADLGGGWRLRLLEKGEEVGGGVFPLSAYVTAQRTPMNRKRPATPTRTRGPRLRHGWHRGRQIEYKQPWRGGWLWRATTRTQAAQL